MKSTKQKSLLIGLPLSSIKKRIQLYCILNPLIPVEGTADDEALVCYLECTEDGTVYMHKEEDFNICSEIFEECYKCWTRPTLNKKSECKLRKDIF